MEKNKLMRWKIVPILLIQKNSLSINVVMLILGLVCLILGFLVIFLYRKKITKERKYQEEFKLKEIQTKYKIFYFWGHIAYVLIIFSSFIGSIVFLSIFFGSL